VVVATHLEKTGCKWFGVATVDEGIALRDAGVRARILVMSGAGAHLFAKDLCDYDLTPLVSSVDEIEEIASECRGRSLEESFKVHLDFDTGMTRGGFLSLDEPERLLGYTDVLRFEGMSTHFAKAEEPNCSFSAIQMDRFANVLHEIAQTGLKPKYIHLDKSAAVLLHSSNGLKQEVEKIMPGAEILVRPGISLYGIDPTLESIHAGSLKPVLSWRAPIVLCKSIQKGTAVGYDGTFVANRLTQIAIVRIGYADGLKRTLSNRGSMIVGGMAAPIVGRISMDLTALDVTDLVSLKGPSHCEVGNFAIVIGTEGEKSQSVYDLALACDTIPYEILTSISARVQRYAL
jgi:alanine racemase